jgi:hypothetical protein
MLLKGHALKQTQIKSQCCTYINRNSAPMKINQLVAILLRTYIGPKSTPFDAESSVLLTTYILLNDCRTFLSLVIQFQFIRAMRDTNISDKYQFVVN